VAEAKNRSLAENVEVSIDLLNGLVAELRETAVKLERSKVAIEAELDIVKTAEILIRKIQKFQEHHVSPKEPAP